MFTHTSARTAITAQRMARHRAIRQLHLWAGAWGALAAILFGVSGFVQNHRALLKLPQGDSTELSKVEVGVPESARATPEALRDWLRESLHVPIDSVRVQPGQPADFNGQPVQQPGHWMLSGGNARVTWNADYTPGNATVAVRNTEQSTLATLLRLHKGVGGGAGWVLLSDSFALAMVALGISGLMLWSRGRTARQIAFSALGAAVVGVLLVGGMAVV